MEIYSLFDSLFGADPMDEINAQLDQLLALTETLLENVEVNRQTIIQGYMSGVHSDMQQTLIFWQQYAASEDPADRQLAINKSIEALSDITSYAALAPVERAALAPMMVAATALRLQIMEDLQDSAYSAELRGEVTSAITDLQSMLVPLRDELEQNIVVRISDVEVAGYDALQLNPAWYVTVQFLTDSTEPDQRASLTTVRFLHDPRLVLPDTIGDERDIPGVSIGYPDPQVGDIVNTPDFLAWVERNGWAAQVSPATDPVTNIDYDRAGGNDLEALISDMQGLITGEWFEGSNNVNDYLERDFNDPDQDLPDVFDGRSGNDTLSGADGDNVLRGGDGNDLLLGGGGNDILRGGDDDDRLHGGTGNDDIDGGDGTDIVIYATSDSAVRVDLRVEFAQDTGQGLDAISNVENVEGSFYNDTLIANDSDNLLIGRTGNDSLFGFGGDDTLDGGEGDDTLVGGDDNDTAVYSNFALAATVDLALNGSQNTGDFGLDQLFSIENLISGDGTDQLRGDGNNNRLESGGGNDTLQGRGGNDTLNGGSGEDTFIYTGGADVIEDFNGDLLDMSAVWFGDQAQLLAIAQVQNGNLVFNFGLGDTLTLIGITDASVLQGRLLGVNISPTAVADTATTDEDSAVLIDVLANDTDPDTTDTLTVRSASIQSGLGTVSVAVDGSSITYDPGAAYQYLASGQSATVEVLYEVTDGNGGTSSAVATVTVNGTSSTNDVESDLTGDGTSDILLRSATGALGFYDMAGGTPSWTGLGIVATSWTVTGTGDFNGDGTDDILLRNSSGATGYYDMDGGIPTWVGLGTVASSWSIVGTGDFNGDDIDDILWRNASGVTGFHEMTGGTPGWSGLGPVPLSWEIAGTGDFNGDGTDDILWRNGSGVTGYYDMAGGSPSWVGLGGVALSWTIVGTGDFNGDGTDDILLRDASGVAGFFDMGSGTPAWVGLGSETLDLDIVGTGDFDGDGTDDILWRNVNDGALGMYEMDNGSPTWNGLGPLALSWDVTGQFVDEFIF